MTEQDKQYLEVRSRVLNDLRVEYSEMISEINIILKSKNTEKGRKVKENRLKDSLYFYMITMNGFNELFKDEV